MYFMFSFDPIELNVEDLWPDGDAPENPTVKDVRALIAQDGGAQAILSEWFLDDLLAASMSITKIEG